MKQLLIKFLARFPRLKRPLRNIRNRWFLQTSVSGAYQQIEEQRIEEETERLRSSWQSETLPERQRALVDRQLAAYAKGVHVDVFDTLIEGLTAINPDKIELSLLEIGCSSGYYSEVLKIKNMPIRYSGCDYSSAFIALGSQYHPSTPLSVEDATRLSFADNSFDIAVSGCCLLHIPEFEKAIAETSRVARSFVIFHRTPVIRGLPHQYFRKQAYGVETVEIHFNEEELTRLFRQYGLECIKTLTLSEEVDPANPSVTHYNRTYVCRKTSNAA